MSEYPTTRRSFVRGAAVGFGLALGWTKRGAAQEGQEKQEPDPWAGLLMGIQSYSLREYNVLDALDRTKSLGIHYWESFSNHLPVTNVPAELAAYKKNLANNSVRLLAYGVQSFDQDEIKSRAQFEFAKAMEIKTISADPSPESLDQLDRLVEEYGIHIAIHNHGPGTRYDKINDVVQALADHHPFIGACIDTGHYIRSNEDPLEALATFKDRTYGVHLKDVKTLENGQKQFTILGQGDLNVVALLKQLKSMNYSHCLALEYEENPKNPIPDIKECLAVVRDTLKNLSAAT